MGHQQRSGGVRRQALPATRACTGTGCSSRSAGVSMLAQRPVRLGQQPRRLAVIGKADLGLLAERVRHPARVARIRRPLVSSPRRRVSWYSSRQAAGRGSVQRPAAVAPAANSGSTSSSIQSTSSRTPSNSCAGIGDPELHAVRRPAAPAGPSAVRPTRTAGRPRCRCRGRNPRRRRVRASGYRTSSLAPARRVGVRRVRQRTRNSDLHKVSAHGPSAAVRPAHPRGAGHPVRPAVVHRRLGFLKSVAVAPAELEGAFSEGIGFDGSAIEGFASVFESDMVARPDPSTFQVLPWEADGGRVYSARMFCDITMPDGSPSWADPRHVLRRAMGEAAVDGLHLLRAPGDRVLPAARTCPMTARVPEPADQGGFFDQASHDAAPHFRRRAIETLEAMGISVEFSHHEGAPGQQEIDLRYADALTMADNIMSFRYVVKEVALTQGVRASFMPKPFVDQPGSAMHTHFSLFDGETNAFHNPDDEYQLSRDREARSWPACMRARAGDHRRVLPVGELLQAAGRRATRRRPRRPGGPPTGPRWSGCRTTRPGKSSSQRLEFRLPDSACNPYLMYTVVIAAGLQGHPRGVRAAGAGGGQRLVAVRGRAAGDGLPEAADVAGVGARRDGGLRAGRRGARRARLRLLPAQQARPSGRTTAGRSRRWSSSGTCRCSRAVAEAPHARSGQLPREIGVGQRGVEGADGVEQAERAVHGRAHPLGRPLRVRVRQQRRASGRPARAAGAAAAPAARAAGGAPRG